MNTIHQVVRRYIKENISFQENPIDHQLFIEILQQYPIDKTIATELVWVILGAIELFCEDFETVVEKCSDDLTFKLLQFCIDNGADMNDSIQQEHDMDWHAKYPDYNNILDIMYYLAKIKKTHDISILVIVMARCMAYSANKSTITDSDMLQLVLSNISRYITIDEVYIIFRINAIDRLLSQKQTMPLLDLFFKYTDNLPLEILYDAVDHKDNVACQYFLKYHYSRIDVKNTSVDNIDVIYIPAIILQSSNSISLRLVESLSKSAISSYCSEVGNTLLHFACNRGHEQIVKVLLSKGVEINKRNNFGESAIFWACKNGNPYIVSYILKKEVNQSYDTLLGYAKRFNRPTVRKVILEFKYGKIWYAKTKVTVISLIDQFKDIELGVIQKIVAFT